MKKPVVLFIILAVLFTKESRGNYFMLLIDKNGYTKSDTIRYSVFTQLIPCYGNNLTANVVLRDAGQRIVSHQILRITNEQTDGLIPLAGIGSGYYFLSVVGQVAYSTGKADGNTIGIPVDLPRSLMQQLEKPVIDFFPESGNSLLNFTNRFLITFMTRSGNPIKEKIYVRNQHNLLLAVCQTNRFGWGAADLPSVAGDSLFLSDSKMKILDTMIVLPSKRFSRDAFSICLSEVAGNMGIQVRKGESSQLQKVYLEIYDNSRVLTEIPLSFMKDTVIVKVPLYTEQFRNKILKLLLKDAASRILAERYLYIDPESTANNRSERNAHVFCNSQVNATSLYLDAGNPALNDGLIALKSTVTTTDYIRENGFTISFSNPEYPNEEIDYYIHDSGNKIIQVGRVIADSSGQIQISNCTFSGKAFVKFYLNKAEITGFKELPLRINIAETENIQKLMSQLAGPDLKKYVDPASLLISSDSNVKVLENINLTATGKGRLIELEKKYVSNGLFRDHNSIPINIEDDPLARNYPLTDYLVRKIPGLFIYDGELRYRSGYVEVYIDEMYFSDQKLNNVINLNDIGYIKFYRNPISSGLSASGIGSVATGNSYAAGIQGSLSIYTRKFSSGINNQSYKAGLLIQGYAN